MHQVKALSPLQTQLSHLSSGIGFFKFPPEIRERIYSMILRPEIRLYSEDILRTNETLVYRSRLSEEDQDQSYWGPSSPANFIGCTSILATCKQVYLEGVDFLHLQDVRLTVTTKRAPILRPADAFGMPGFFRAQKRSTKIFLYPRFCELQLLRLRRIHLYFDLQDGRDINIGNLTRHVNDLSNAFQKSADLISVKIELAFSIIPEDFASFTLIKSFDRLVKVARRKSFKIYFTVNGGFEGTTGNMARYLNSKLANANASVDGRAMVDGVLTLGTTIIKSPSTYGQFRPRTYKKIPECHHCLKVFSSRSALRGHLRSNPGHVHRFRLRTYNTISTSARHGGDRKCSTCAEAFVNVVGLKAHEHRLGHGRFGVVPRFKEDNEKWDKKWRDHHDKFGWH